MTAKILLASGRGTCSSVRFMSFRPTTRVRGYIFVHDSLVFLENIARELLWAIIPFDHSSPPPVHSESNPPNKTDTSRANNAVDSTKPQILGEEDDTVMNTGTESCCFGNSDSMKTRQRTRAGDIVHRGDLGTSELATTKEYHDPNQFSQGLSGQPRRR